MMVQPRGDWNGDNDAGPLDHPTCQGVLLSLVRAENLDPDVLVMQPANQGARHDPSGLLNRARDRSILIQ